MTYTLWSHGHLLGESALDYVRVIRNLRTGDLHVTEKGLTVAERLSQSREDSYRNAKLANAAPSKDALHEADRALHADLACLNDQYEALALELRAPDGTLIPTEDIYLTDTEYLLRINQERDEELMDDDDDLDADALAAAEDMLAAYEADHPPWLPEPPERPRVRFQISVTLIDEWSIP